MTRNTRYHFVGGGFRVPVNQGAVGHPDFGATLHIVYDWTTRFGAANIRTATLQLKPDGAVTEVKP